MPNMTLTVTPPAPVPVPAGMPFAHVTHLALTHSTEVVEGTVVFGNVGLWFEVHPDGTVIEEPGNSGNLIPAPDLSSVLQPGADAGAYLGYVRKVISTAADAYVLVVGTSAQATAFLLQGLSVPPVPADEAAAARIRNLEDLLATLNLFTSRHTWTQLTTEQKELFAEVIDDDHARGDAQDGLVGTPLASTPHERWWR